MGLEKIHLENIATILEKILRSYFLFVSYRLVKNDVQKLNNPTKITNYDFTFVSEEHNRWLFIRLEDFFSHQNLIIWINQLHSKQNVNIDIKTYFISELGNRTIKQKLISNSKTEKDLEVLLTEVFNYLIEQSDDKLKKIILGEIWIDMPMDWGGYK